MQYHKEYSYSANNNEIKCGFLSVIDKKYYVNDVDVINNRSIINDDVYVFENEIIGIKQRSTKNIVGILYLDSKIKYGNVKDKSLFLFKPTNRDYPHFYVPYKTSGSMIKKYCIIQFKEWKTTDKLPLGTLIDVIGDIGNKDAEIEHLRNYYDIKNNNWRIDKNKQEDDLKKLSDLQEETPDYKVFSIDPEGSIDIDDAFHFKCDNQIEVGIHIASPNVFFEDNLIDVLNRVSTVYIPDKKYNMLPNCYADDYISLLEKKNRHALSLILTIGNDNQIIGYEIKRTIVKNIKNYTYENFNMNKHKHNDFIEFSSAFFTIDLSDSHKLVEYWMIYTNKMIATHMINNNMENIILRKHEYTDICTEQHPSAFLNTYLKQRSEKSASYVLYKYDQQQTHSKMDNSYYTHFTSPIRRAVDFYTHMLLVKNDIIEKTILEKSLENINRFTKNCRKFDRNIRRLNFLFEIKQSTETYGYIININNLTLTLYIPEYNLEEKVVVISDKQYNLYEKVNIKLWVFTSFENFFDKLKVEIIA